jgi:hypothetical protein
MSLMRQTKPTAKVRNFVKRRPKVLKNGWERGVENPIRTILKILQNADNEKYMFEKSRK